MAEYPPLKRLVEGSNPSGGTDGGNYDSKMQRYDTFWGRSSMVEHLPFKLAIRVRFPTALL